MAQSKAATAKAPAPVVGKMTGRIPALKRAPSDPANGYRLGARSFLAGVRALSTTSSIDELFSCHLLAAFALECAYKSYIARAGAPDVARAGGHDLVRLSRDAEARGFAVPHEFDFEIGVLQQLSTGPHFYVRYRSGADGAALITGPVLLMIVEDVVNKMEAAMVRKATP